MIRFHTILEELDAGGWSANGNNYENIVWKDDGKKKPTKKEFEDKKKELEEKYIANKYQRDRLAEYPSVQELVVALYDADDKAEIDKKRAEIKKKYPKPE